MKLEIFVNPRRSPYREDMPSEVIRSTCYRVVIRIDKQCWEVQERPNAAHAALWRHFAYSSSRDRLAGLWNGLHGACACHCWPELAYLPAIFGGGG